ncbi:DUF6644 family protein [Chelativorans sp.]|uniref:DUF6644 family protein n=1 Tax=Chelativorans sp. TaxID=2203393 RepID=UPI002810BCB2|nr:DUF6644 family protein [Chelativorans sp.]
MLIEIVDAMAGWPPVGYVRTSPAAYATVNATHIVGISLLVGAIISSDLRTAGLWKADLWREGLETCVPVAAFGLVLAAISGVMLFSVRGGTYLADPAFQIKALLLAAGLVNVFVFRLAMARTRCVAPSMAMRLSAFSSMVIWVGAIFAGRWIAFTYYP